MTQLPRCVFEHSPLPNGMPPPELGISCCLPSLLSEEPFFSAESVRFFMCLGSFLHLISEAGAQVLQSLFVFLSLLLVLEQLLLQLMPRLLHLPSVLNPRALSRALFTVAVFRLGSRCPLAFRNSVLFTGQGIQGICYVFGQIGKQVKLNGRNPPGVAQVLELYDSSAMPLEVSQKTVVEGNLDAAARHRLLFIQAAILGELPVAEGARLELIAITDVTRVSAAISDAWDAYVLLNSLMSFSALRDLLPCSGLVPTGLHIGSSTEDVKMVTNGKAARDVKRRSKLTKTKSERREMKISQKSTDHRPDT